MSWGGKRRRSRDHLYSIPTSPSMRWAGIKGDEAFVEVATYDVPEVTIRGLKCGEMAFPVSEIETLRVGIEHGRWTHYRTLLRRRGGGSFILDGTRAMADYRALILHLVDEMEAVGHFDRVERGLRYWEGGVYLVIFGGICLALCYAPYDSWLRWGHNWTQQDRLFAGGLLLVGLALLATVLWLWFRWYRPRRVRDAADLEKVLPNVDVDDYMP